jgi:hypothetical protein
MEPFPFVRDRSLASLRDFGSQLGRRESAST